MKAKISFFLHILFFGVLVFGISLYITNLHQNKTVITICSIYIILGAFFEAFGINDTIMKKDLKQKTDINK